MIHLCVLTHNRLPALQRLIESIRPVLGEGVRLIVLDQASDDGTWRLLQRLPETRGHALRSRVNLGCAGGRQFIADSLQRVLAPDDVLVFIDDDCYATNATWLDALTGPILQGEADITGVDGRIVGADGLTFPALSRSVDYVSGGRMAVRAEVFDHCNFDTDYNPNYYEDVDFCRWAQLEKFRLVAVGDVGLAHDDHPGDPMIAELNRQKFLHKWADQP